jgi:hypothetical protein
MFQKLDLNLVVEFIHQGCKGADFHGCKRVAVQIKDEKATGLARKAKQGTPDRYLVLSNGKPKFR